MTGSSYNNGISETRTYNADSTVATIQYSNPAIGNFSYTWDANHNKTSETISGVMSGYGFTASYDNDDRLIDWERSDSNLDQSWNLSAVGNWNSVTQNATTQTRTHSPANEILTAASLNVQHDPKGNATLYPSSLWPSGTSLAMKWDFNNKLRAADTNNDATDDVFYLWDALGRRVGRTASGATTIYVQNDQQTVADYPSGALASSPTYTYLWGSYIDELVLRTASAGNLYFHRNQQYSVTAVTTSAGAITERYAYSPYGELTILNSSAMPITSSAIDNRYTYTGREWDSVLKLYHFRARMMSPVAGRFLGRDPIGYEGSQWSLYEFLKSFATRYLDPYGEQSVRGPQFVYQCSCICDDTCWVNMTGTFERQQFYSNEPCSIACPKTMSRWTSSHCSANDIPLTPDQQSAQETCINVPEHPKCRGCNDCGKGMSQIFTAIKNTWLLNFLGYPIGANTCERWAFEFEKQITKLNGGHSPCYSVNVGCSEVTGSLTTSAHAYIAVTLCTGEVLHLDNGSFGGSDHIVPLTTPIPPVIKL